MNNADKQSIRRMSMKGSEDPNAQIARKLRSFYLSVQEESVPQRFVDLLEKLDAAEQQHSSLRASASE